MPAVRGIIGGVCARIALFLRVSPLLIRGIFLFLLIVSRGFAIVVYLILWFALPRITYRGDRDDPFVPRSDGRWRGSSRTEEGEDIEGDFEVLENERDEKEDGNRP